MVSARVQLFIALISIAFQATSQQCNSDTGPAGGYACVSIGRYIGKQYATCLTNQYIQRKSGGKHICENRWATYCYYQCMMEIHSINSGAVLPDCSCEDATGATPTPFTTGPTLPPYCYSPSGDTCSWYEDCLERKIACGAETGYALAFAKKYCELYNDHYDSFTDVTKRWVDAVRKCLQVSLVPLLREFYHPTCQEIKQTAVSQHTKCYLAPYEGAPSICDAIKSGVFEIFQIFFTIKGSLVESDITLFVGSWKSILKVSASCVIDYLKLGAIYAYEFIVQLASDNGRSKRSTSDEPGDIAILFASALSNSLGWPDRGIQWIPTKSNLTLDGHVSFQLLIGDRRELDLNSNYTTPINMSLEMENLKAKVQAGEAAFGLMDGHQYYAKRVSECGNIQCSSVQSIVVAPEYAVKSAEGSRRKEVLPAAVSLCSSLLLILSTI